MNEYETMEELKTLIADLHWCIHKMGGIGKASDHVQEARMDQYARQMLSAVDYLYTIRDDILDETYTDVKDALVTDHQYAAESIMHWQSKGQDLSVIAEMLETSLEALIDIIDECTTNNE